MIGDYCHRCPVLESELARVTAELATERYAAGELARKAGLLRSLLIYFRDFVTDEVQPGPDDYLTSLVADANKVLGECPC